MLVPLSRGPLCIANSCFYSKSSFSLENWSCRVCRETYFLDASSVEGSNSRCSEQAG